jgi:hypothetical protein
MNYDIRNRHLAAELERVRGALSHIATRDSDAVRRVSADEEVGAGKLFGPGSADQDSWIRGYMSPWEADRLALLPCKSVRRLGNKSQVITLPASSHIRDRQDHCLSSSQLGVVIARILGLNVPLIETGMLVHDGGHLPGGHLGEVLSNAKKGWDGKNHPKIKHSILGVILFQSIERGGNGLNPTGQVLDIVLNHTSGEGKASVSRHMLPETALSVKVDKGDYIFADFNDLLVRAPLASQGISSKHLPHIMKAVRWFGRNQRERIFTFVANLCIESAEKGYISFDECEAAVRFEELKAMMYSDVYKAIDHRTLWLKMSIVYDSLEKALPDVDPVLAFGMLDDVELEHIFQMHERHEIINEKALGRFSIGEVIKHLKGKEIDLTDPDLGWAESALRRD